MSPLDDQLRAALQGRAGQLAPSPDPLAGIEARARGIRRRRVATSVAGAALAVAAVALAVPTFVDGASPSRPLPPATPGPSVVANDALLDPDHPWAFRGTPLTDGTLAHFRAEWQVKH